MRINPLRERWPRGEVASCLWIDIGRIKAKDDSIAIAREQGIVAGAYASSVDVAKAAVARGLALVSVGYAAKLMIKAAGDVLGQVLPGRARP